MQHHGFLFKETEGSTNIFYVDLEHIRFYHLLDVYSPPSPQKKPNKQKKPYSWTLALMSALTWMEGRIAIGMSLASVFEGYVV